MDLSFPRNNSVNSGIPKDQYLGQDFHLAYPSVDQLAHIILDRGPGCLLYKRDLRRAYRQLPVDPGDIHLLGFKWDGYLYIDRVLPFGLRSAAMACQRTTNAIAHIQNLHGFDIVNYLDDFAGCEKPLKATSAFNSIGETLTSLGLEEALDKACPPNIIMDFLGITFNTENMTMEVTKERLLEITQLLDLWATKKSATKVQLQSLLGKLQFVAKCVRPGRLFIARMLPFLSKLKAQHHRFHLDTQFRKDLSWWSTFLGQFNGISILYSLQWSKPDGIFSTDACPTGCGGFFEGNYFHTTFPEHIANQNLHINQLELLVVMVALRLWSQFFNGKRIRILCDNIASVLVINSGKSKDAFANSCLRDILFICATSGFEIRSVHLAGIDNRLSDHLSRWHLGSEHHKAFFQEATTSSYSLREWEVPSDIFKFTSTW